MAGKWFDTDPPRSEVAPIAIEVPSVWQQYVDADSGIARYTKTFSFPQELLRRALRLRFGAEDYHARVWLNGHELGGHEGAFSPFEVDIGGAVLPRTNRLAVHVSDAARVFVHYYVGLPGWERPPWETIDGIDFDHISGFQDWREGFNHCEI